MPRSSVQPLPGGFEGLLTRAEPRDPGDLPRAERPERFVRSDHRASLQYISEEVEFVAPPDFSGGGRVYRGHQAMGEALAEWIAAWDDYRFELRELIDGDGDEVLVEGHQRGRAKGSGVEVSETIYSVWTVPDGKAVRWRSHGSEAEALAAVGLRE